VDQKELQDFEDMPANAQFKHRAEKNERYKENTA
jgi:hypothetical protein